MGERGGGVGERGEMGVEGEENGCVGERVCVGECEGGGGEGKRVTRCRRWLCVV